MTAVIFKLLMIFILPFNFCFDGQSSMIITGYFVFLKSSLANLWDCLRSDSLYDSQPTASHISRSS